MQKIGLVVAMVSEQEKLFSRLGQVVAEDMFGNIKVTTFNYNGCEVYMADSGIGEISAALSTQLLILKYGVEIILNFGVVGSLSSRFKCKDIALVNEVVHYDFSLQLSDSESFGKYPFQRDSFVFALNNDILERVNNVIGNKPLARIVTGDKFIDKSDVRNWLIDHFNGEICDMESAGIYLACRNFAVPCVMLKAVSDNADEEAVESFENIVAGGIDFYVDAVCKIIDNFAK